VRCAQSISLKGTVSAISSDPPCKDGNARFTTVSLKTCRIKYELDINIFITQKLTLLDTFFDQNKVSTVQL